MPSKLDVYHGIIDERLGEFPELTAVRLFDEVQAAGYRGSYTQVKEYVRRIRPKPEPEPVQRFETPPGRQGQVDFAEFKLPWGKRYALLVVLGYSRLLWLEFHRRQTMEVLMRGLEAAFAYFGGVPEELLFDQLKAVIIDDQRVNGGALLKNAEFLRFAEHWGFTIRACRPYRAKTKGKVERPIRYVRQSFFYGRHYLNDEDLNAQAWSWLERTANARKHRTTGERPRVRFERDERAVLRPLADRPYRSPLVLPPAMAVPAEPRMDRPMPEVERRPLAVYGELSRLGP
jgi:transposase